MRLVSLVLPLVLLLGFTVSAQTSKYGFGRTPTAGEILAWDITIDPQGTNLPEGSGTVAEGETLFLSKGCAGCHGLNLTDGLAPRLLKRDVGQVEDPWDYGRVLPIRSPFATTVWDYINRGMPLNAEGTLTPDEVYSITAYLLFENEVIEEDMVLDQDSLPQIEMPNENNWAPLPDWWEPGMPRLRDYPW